MTDTPAMSLIDILIEFTPAFVITALVLFFLEPRSRRLFNIVLLFVFQSLPMTAAQAVLPDYGRLTLPGLAFSIAYLVYSLWLYRQLITDESYTRLFYCQTLILAISVIFTLPVKAALIHLFDIPPGQRLITLQRLGYLFVSIPAMPLLYRYARRPFHKLLDTVETQKWYIVGPIPLCYCLLGLAASAALDTSPEHPAAKLASIVLPATIVLYILSMSAFLLNRSARLLLQQRLTAAEQLEKTYQFYNIELSRREQSLRKLRHDFRHHLVHLEALARDGNMEAIESHLKSLSGFDASFAVTSLCENPTVNAIVSFYLTMAEKNGTVFTARALVPEKLAIPGADLSLLIGNALENSVKATAPLGGQGYIAFTANLAKNHLVLKFSNNHDKKTYPHGQGVGLESIRDLAEKYHGHMHVAENAREFELTVYLRLLGS